MKKSILYLGNFSPKKSFAALNRALGICKLFASQGYENHILIHDFDDSFLEDNYLICNKIIAHGFSFSKIGFYFCSGYLFDLIKKISNLKIIILYNFPYIPSKKVVSYCKKNGIKIVGDITEWYDLSNVNFLFKPIKLFDTEKRMKKLCFELDGLILISNYLYQFYKNVKNRIKIYPLMDYAIRDANNTNKSNNSNVILIGYAGIAGNSKDDLVSFSNILLDNDIKNIQIEIIGSVNKKVLSYLNKTGINYNYYGRLDHNSTIKLLNKCDCQVIFRYKSRMNNAGFPTKFAESICLEIPVIATNISDLYHFSSDNVFIFDNNPQELKLFLSNLKHNKTAFDKSMFFSNQYLLEFSSFLDDLNNVND